MRFEADSLGMLDGPETVGAGDEGEIVGPHPNLEGWYLVRPDRYPDRLCPASDHFFTVERR